MYTLYLIDGVQVPKKTWDRAKALGEVARFETVMIKPKETKRVPSSNN